MNQARKRSQKDRKELTEEMATIAEPVEQEEQEEVDNKEAENSEQSKKLHKVDLHNLTAIKTALDDQIYKYFVSTCSYEADLTLLDLKNVIGVTACIIAGFTYFLTSLPAVVISCALFFSLVLLIQYINFYVESDTILMTKVVPQYDHIVRVDSNYKSRYSQFVEVVLTMIPNKRKKKNKKNDIWFSNWMKQKQKKSSAKDGRVSRTLQIDVAKYFDEEGSLHKPKLRTLVQDAHKDLENKLKHKK